MLSFGVKDAVGTVGRWQVQPNAVNSVPRKVQLDIDIRDIDQARRDEVVEAVQTAAQQIATQRKVRDALDSQHCVCDATSDSVL